MLRARPGRSAGPRLRSGGRWRARGSAASHAENVRTRQPGACGRKRRIELYCLLIAGNRALSGQARGAGLVVSRPQVRLVCIGSDRSAAAVLRLSGRAVDVHGCRERLRGVCLQAERIVDAPFIGVRPEVRLGVEPDQLHGQPDLVPNSHDGAFNNRIDAEFALDLCGWRGAPLLSFAVVRETTRSELILPSSVVSPSVMPLAR